MSAEPLQSFPDHPSSSQTTIRHLHANGRMEPPEDDGDDTVKASAPRPKARGSARKLRTALLGGTACVALLGLIVWMAAPHRGHQQGQEVGVNAPAPQHAALAPRAREVPATPAPKPAVPKSQTKTARAQPAPPQAAPQAPRKAGDDDLNAMLALGPLEKGAASPARSEPAHPESAANNPTPDAVNPAPTGTPVLAHQTPVQPDVSAARASPNPPPVTKPDDAAQRAAKLVAAPMSPKDQIDVLQLVTEEAALVQQSRAEVAALKAQMQQAEGSRQQHDRDLDRRLSMVEARKAVASAASAQTDAREAAAAQAREALSAALGKPRPASHPVPAEVDVSASDTPQRAPVPVSGAAAQKQDWVPHYRILAASPQLAMVSDDAAPPGQPTQYEIQVGTELHGYGTVRSISQVGTNWVITTDHGRIL